MLLQSLKVKYQNISKNKSFSAAKIEQMISPEIENKEEFMNQVNKLIQSLPTNDNNTH